MSNWVYLKVNSKIMFLQTHPGISQTQDVSNATPSTNNAGEAEHFF